MPPEEGQALIASSSEARLYDYGEQEDPVASPSNDADPERRRRSSVRFSVTSDMPTLKKLDTNNPHIRRSVVRRESFIVQFAKTKGPPQITFLMMLLAIGGGMTIGVVPSVMTDRFARLNHGYDSDISCTSYDSKPDLLGEKPSECYQGSADAQTAVATSNLISNGLTFVTSSLIGSLSDEYGRRGKLFWFCSFVVLSAWLLSILVPGGGDGGVSFGCCQFVQAVSSLRWKHHNLYPLLADFWILL